MQRYFKSMTDEDKCPIVICNLEHEIIYMNPAACERYGKYGGDALVGKSLMACHNEKSCEMIERVLSWFKKSRDNNRVYTYHSQQENKDVYMIALRDKNGELIGYYEKHEYRNHETMALYKMD